MASVTVTTAAQADAILGKSVVSGTINGSGHLILTRQNGETFDAGDFSGILTDIAEDAVSALVGPAVAAVAAGTLFPKGDISGTVNFTEANANTLVNAMFTAKLVGNVTINSSTAFPTGPKPGTQFAVRFTQDATGGRTLTLTGIKKSFGILDLSTPANSIDIVVFMFDGTNWYAGLMGAAFA